MPGVDGRVAIEDHQVGLPVDGDGADLALTVEETCRVERRRLEDPERAESGEGQLVERLMQREARQLPRRPTAVTAGEQPDARVVEECDEAQLDRVIGAIGPRMLSERAINFSVTSFHSDNTPGSR